MLGSALLAVLALLASMAEDGVGQTVSGSADARVEAVRVAPDTIELGDRFDLAFTLRFPEGSVVFFPDSLDAAAFESFSGVELSVERTDGDVVLSVRYPLIAFRTGSMPVEGIDVFVGPAGEVVAAGFAADGDLVGSWESFRAQPGAVPSARPLAVPEQRVEVATVLTLDDETTQIRPRPAADVSGQGRNWTWTLLTAVFGLLLVGVVSVSARDLVRTGPAPPSPLTARERALAALDDILETGLHEDGRIRDFYGAWSDVVRRYVESFAEPLGPAWTSTELMAELQGPRRSEVVARALDAEAISDEMRNAERVKFGGVRPNTEEAAASLRAVRAWIAGARETDA